MLELCAVLDPNGIPATVLTTRAVAGCATPGWAGLWTRAHVLPAPPIKLLGVSGIARRDCEDDSLPTQNGG